MCPSMANGGMMDSSTRDATRRKSSRLSTGSTMTVNSSPPSRARKPASLHALRHVLHEREHSKQRTCFVEQTRAVPLAPDRLAILAIVAGELRRVRLAARLQALYQCDQLGFVGRIDEIPLLQSTAQYLVL